MHSGPTRHPIGEKGNSALFDKCKPTYYTQNRDSQQDDADGAEEDFTIEFRVHLSLSASSTSFCWVSLTQ